MLTGRRCGSSKGDLFFFAEVRINVGFFSPETASNPAPKPPHSTHSAMPQLPPSSTSKGSTRSLLALCLLTILLRQPPPILNRNLIIRSTFNQCFRNQTEVNPIKGPDWSTLWSDRSYPLVPCSFSVLRCTPKNASENFIKPLTQN